MSEMAKGPRSTDVSFDQIKYALFDIDNTLVDNESPAVPSDRFCQAVAAAQERHILVGIASARPLQKVQHVIDHTGLKGISILSNGAQIYDPATAQMLSELSVDPQATAEILAELRAQNITHWVQDDGEDCFWVDADQQADTYQKSSDPWTMPTSETAIILERYQPRKPLVIVAREVGAQTLKNLRVLSQSYADRHVALLPAHERTNQQGDPVFDVFFLHTDANKRDALPLACQAANVTLEQTMMTGDGLNDIAILEQTGIAVAVANAHPEAKTTATHLTASYDQDGAAIALETIVHAQTQ